MRKKTHSAQVKPKGRQKYKNQILVVKKSTLSGVRRGKKNGKKRSISSAKPVIPRARLLLFPIIRWCFWLFDASVRSSSPPFILLRYISFAFFFFALFPPRLFSPRLESIRRWCWPCAREEWVLTHLSQIQIQDQLFYTREREKEIQKLSFQYIGECPEVECGFFWTKLSAISNEETFSMPPQKRLSSPLESIKEAKHSPRGEKKRVLRNSEEKFFVRGWKNFKISSSDSILDFSHFGSYIMIRFV